MGHCDVNRRRGQRDEYARCSKRKPGSAHISGLRDDPVSSEKLGRLAGEIADGSVRRTALPLIVRVIVRVARTRLDPPRTRTGVEQIQTPTESFHKFTLRAPQTARTIPVLGRRDSSRREGRDYRAFARHSGCAAKRAARQWSPTTGGNGIAARPLLMRRFCDGATRGRMAGRERRVPRSFGRS